MDSLDSETLFYCFDEVFNLCYVSFSKRPSSKLMFVQWDYLAVQHRVKRLNCIECALIYVCISLYQCLICCEDLSQANRVFTLNLISQVYGPNPSLGRESSLYFCNLLNSRTITEIKSPPWVCLSKQRFQRNQLSSICTLAQPF